LLVAPSHFPSNNAAADIAVRVAKALESYKELHFLFVGAKPGTAQNVTWLQFIPDIRDALWASDIAMAPFPVDARAGGARNKVLEYMSAGLPLVATAEGMRGIPNACPGVHYKQAEYSVDSIAADILELARDIKTRQKLGSSARALICTENSWKSKGEQLACLLRQVEQT
jgi:glycosyltransferase involved in cell wall biosynthesis